jgi:hypothetical protein
MMADTARSLNYKMAVFFNMTVFLNFTIWQFLEFIQDGGICEYCGTLKFTIWRYFIYGTHRAKFKFQVKFQISLRTAAIFVGILVVVIDLVT